MTIHEITENMFTLDSEHNNTYLIPKYRAFTERPSYSADQKLSIIFKMEALRTDHEPVRSNK
jgi:hypothetical protein